MARVSSPDGPSWRGSSPAFTPPPVVPTEPAWRASGAVATYRSRWWKLGLVGVGLAACLAAVSYAALWLKPPDTAKLIVLEAAYATNLTVPPNATGVGAGRDLITLVNSAAASRGRLRTSEPVRLTRGGTLLPELDTLKDRTAIVFVAAHGGRDPDGAFLFPDDTTTDPAHRVRIKAVIDRLAKLPATTHKVLILDATQPSHYADLGLLHNDFADALVLLDSTIAAVPNLVVLSSTGIDQRSWTSPEWGRTTFSHYLHDGLNGSADSDHNQRLTVWELFEHVRPRVHDWARDNRAALQKPVLLPKADGEARARAITLASVTEAKASPAVAPTPFEPPAELQQLWGEYRTLASANPSPIAYAPHIWREYEAWVLRYESLFLEGTPEAAGTAFAKAADARRRMEALRKLPVPPQNLAIPFSLGGLTRPKEFPAAIVSGLAQLAAATETDRSKLWASIRNNVPGADPESLRILWCQGLVNWVAVDPANRLAVAPSILALMTEGMPVRPSEIHLLEMFAKHAPKFAKSDELGPLLGQLLESRERGERLASGVDRTGRSSTYAARWDRDEVQRGDGLRRRAEDLSFATSPQSWELAKATDAGPAYNIATNQARLITDAVEAWYRAAAILPGYNDWVAQLRAGEPYPIRHERERLLEPIRAAWNSQHVIARSLDRIPPADAKERAAVLAPIEAEVARLNGVLDLLQSRFLAEMEQAIASRPEFDARRETREELIVWWRKTEGLLATPFGDPAKRLKLAIEARRVSRQLLVTGATNPQPLVEVTPDASRERGFQSARWLGLAELSRVGQQAFPANAGQPSRFEQLEFRLNNFALQADARITLVDVGAALGAALNAPPPSGQLAEADRRVRLMPAAATVPLGPGPADALRRLLTAQVLVNQAERTYIDHWYGGKQPYFRVAVEQLLNDARTILGHKLEKETESLWAKRLEKNAPFPLMPRIGPKLWLTDEPNLAVTYPLERAADDPAGPGYAVFWQEQPFGITKTPIPREVRETGLPLSSAPPSPVTATLTPPAGAKPKAPITVVGNGGLQAFFRGRFADVNSVVQYYPVPDRTSVVVPPPAGATMAVRADPALQAKFGSATGSVALVLDCSGSMRPPKDAAAGDNGRYPVAIEVLEKLLRGLPAGTTVSVWSFGSRTPDVTSADETIKEHLPPTVWARDNSATINSLLATVRGLEPWEESSVMRALLRARQGLVGGPGPFKAVVLVTDAVDNRFAEDRQFNPRKESIKDALKTRLSDSGIRVGVVAIPVTDKSETAAQQQFKAVDALQPAGKFVPPPQAESLLTWLRSGLNPRIRFTVSPVSTDSPSASSFDLSAGDDAADTWYPGRILPGTYSMKVNADREYRFPLSFRRGDRLLLRLIEDRGDLKAERVWYAAEAPAVDRSASQGSPAVLALLQSQTLDDKALKLLATLEDRPSRLAPTLAAEHLGETWFNLVPTTPTATPFALRFTTNWEHPAPCWTLEANGWPTLPDNKTPAASSLEAWWNPAGLAPSALRWDVQPGANPLELPPTRLAVSDNVVSLDSIRLEDHEVPLGPDQAGKKACLVVRFTHAPNKPVWARLVGLAPSGSQVRIFQAANKVTCLFWWPEAPTASRILADLKGLEIVSLSDFQKDAAAAGRHLKLTK